MNGQIKKISSDKGFGFIRADDGTEYFFHHSGLVRGLRFDSLVEGDAVAFEPEDGPKGPRAGQVERG